MHISHFFTFFQCFSPYFTSYSVCFSFSMIFSFFLHNPGPTVCFSHFALFFRVSHHIPGSYHVSFSFFSFVSFLDIFQVLQCAFHIFHGFGCFSHLSPPTVCVSHFPPFSVFLAISRVLLCEFLIFFLFPVL